MQSSMLRINTIDDDGYNVHTNLSIKKYGLELKKVAQRQHVMFELVNNNQCAHL